MEARLAAEGQLAHSQSSVAELREQLAQETEARLAEEKSSAEKEGECGAPRSR